MVASCRAESCGKAGGCGSLVCWHGIDELGERLLSSIQPWLWSLLSLLRRHRLFRRLWLIVDHRLLCLLLWLSGITLISGKVLISGTSVGCVSTGKRRQSDTHEWVDVGVIICCGSNVTAIEAASVGWLVRLSLWGWISRRGLASFSSAVVVGEGPTSHGVGGVPVNRGGGERVEVGVECVRERSERERSEIVKSIDF